MGVHRTCGEPDEIELTPMGVKLNGLRQVPQGAVLGDDGVGRSGRAKKSGNICRAGVLPWFRQAHHTC